MSDGGYSYDKQVAADLEAIRLAHRYNLSLLIAIVACTTAVAVFAQSAAGLWSLLLLLGWKQLEVNLGAPPKPHKVRADQPQS